MKLLPDREIATVAAWMSDHPEITVVSRDRGGGYGEAGLAPHSWLLRMLCGLEASRLFLTPQMMRWRKHASNID
ncbi:hypothetical protein VQ045_21530, partial [Aurantimonas sp. E1-2-R+4]|uniref:hypothetical protein n=1 Tax=Aurantimonas sp. E1-2-R+4 TaxID=3113714 RepID=UPI002F95952D